jgi:hypothetical protein
MSAKVDVARRLAESHYAIEPGLRRIHRLTRTDGAEDAPGEPIKFLEVNENTIAAGMQPLHFGPQPSHGITCPSIIVEVTPGEFEQIERGELKLPDGWALGDAFPRPGALAEVG